MATTSHSHILDSAVLGRLSRLSLTARLPMIGAVSGAHKSALRGSSVEFAEYRKYVPGDDIRRLDWRVFGRTDRFYMKEFEADTNLRCVFLLDCSGSMRFESRHGPKFDYARRLTATLAYLLALQGDAVGLQCFTDRVIRDIPPRHTPSHLRSVLDTIAELTPTGRTSIVDTLHAAAERVRQRALIIVISDFFTPVDALLLGFQHMRFRKHDVAVFHLLDPQELSFEFDRPIRFTDMEGSAGILTDPSIIRSGYRSELDRYLADIRHGCREFNIDYHRIRTDMDYEKVLAEFLLQRLRAKGGRGL